jgi:hypothetical protein
MLGPWRGVLSSRTRNQLQWSTYTIGNAYVHVEEGGSHSIRGVRKEVVRPPPAAITNSQFPGRATKVIATDALSSLPHRAKIRYDDTSVHCSRLYQEAVTQPVNSLSLDPHTLTLVGL